VAASTFGVLPDDEMHAGEPALGEGGIVGGDMAVEDFGEVVADAFAHLAVVAVAGHEDEHGDEAVELVGARQGAHPGALAQRQHRLCVLAQKRHADLEELVARVALEHVDERLAGVIRRVQTRFRDHRLGLRPEIGDLHHRAGVGAGGEQAHHAQLALQIALPVEGLDADIVEIDAAVNDRLGICLGDDQRVGSMQEGADLRGRRHGLGADTQDAQIRIGEDAQSGTVGPVERSGLLAAGIAILAQAEEGEIVVAQPFQEGDGLGDGLLLEGDRIVAEPNDCLLEAGEHRPPVGDRGANLPEDVAEPLGKALRPLGGQRRDMDLNQADAVGAAISPGEASVAHDLGDALRPMADDDDGMHDERRLAQRPGYLAHYGIEEERHVVVDDGDDRDRAVLAPHVGAGRDVDDAVAAPVLPQRGERERGSLVEFVVGIGCDVLGRRARRHDGPEPLRLAAGPAVFRSPGLRLRRARRHGFLSRHIVVLAAW
jgi:hypothetical protein